MQCGYEGCNAQLDIVDVETVRISDHEVMDGQGLLTTWQCDFNHVTHTVTSGFERFKEV